MKIVNNSFLITLSKDEMLTLNKFNALIEKICTVVDEEGTLHDCSDCPIKMFCGNVTVKRSLQEFFDDFVIDVKEEENE